MRISNRFITRQIARSLVVLLSLPFEQAAVAAQQPTVSSAQSQAVPAQQQSVPATPGQKQSSDQSQTVNQSGQSGPPQSGSDQQENGAANPVGTAAAPYEKPTGVAASRPAGAVIAPAKQRRARYILIRVGVIVGVGVAVGTVAALSHASPSRPK